MVYKNGEEFLNHLYSDMHREESVMHTANKSNTPVEKIEKYLNRLERVHDKASKNSHKMEVLKKFYYDKYVIKELPDSYIELQRRMARERGYGDITVTEEMKEELLAHVQNEQMKSLDMWIDYLTSDDAMYPMWFKHYAFRGMLKLNKFDKEKQEFGRRSKTTTEPYIELNREVLAKVYDTIVKVMGSTEEISEEISKALEHGESFKKLYEYYLTNTGYVNRGENTDGIWIKYEQGDNYKPLWESLQGKNTGWCTAGEETARMQLSNGDFYVYYTKDQNGEYTEPRLAIRMDGKVKIGEVRGVGKNQNIEECMMPIIAKKLDEFPDKEQYLKKVHDMELLTKIDQKVKNNLDLTKEELEFLYEISGQIEGFGYKRDPRIEEIKEKRNLKKDYALIFDCKEENIGTSISDFEDENKKIVYYVGNLEYKGETVPASFRYLKYICGNADFKSLKSAMGLENLQTIGEGAYFKSLESAIGLESLQTIGEGAYFKSLESAVGLESLQTIGGDACFGSLKSAEGLENLQTIGKSAYFDALESAIGLESLQTIGEGAYFKSLESAVGLESLQTIGWSAEFSSLVSAEGLEKLHYIGESGYFNKLESAEGLRSLQIIGRDAHFESLVNAYGLESLQTIGWSAHFENLEDAEGLENLKTIDRKDATEFKNTLVARNRMIKKYYALLYHCQEENIGTKPSDLEDASNNIMYYVGDLSFNGSTLPDNFKNLKGVVGSVYFENLESADKLENLQFVIGNAYFNSLRSANGLNNLRVIGRSGKFDMLENAYGLENLQSIGGSVDFDALKSAVGLGNLQSIGGTANFNQLENASGLDSLQTVGDARFDNLVSAKGLESLQTIEVDAHFDKLKSAEGLENLQTIRGTAYFASLESAVGLNNLQTIGWFVYFESLNSAEGLENLRTVNGKDATELKEEINNRGNIRR